ncbi:hypothetical protein [Evansella clarkii]|nr:hypothetical protein [Evansella clarkii]
MNIASPLSPYRGIQKQNVLTRRLFLSGGEEEETRGFVIWKQFFVQM